MQKRIKIFLIVLAVIFAANILLLDFFWVKNQKPSEFRSNADNFSSSDGFESGIVSTPVATDSCGLVCQKIISEKIKEEIEKTTLIAGQSGTSPSPKNSIPTLIPSSQSKIIYIPLASSGTTVLTSWTDIVPSEFYFDLSNYPGAKSVRFEVYLLALHGSAKVYTRLYDSSNNRGVDNSELVTQSDYFNRLESSPVTLWRGNNKYTVQLKSANGTEVQLKDARLKIYY